MDDINQAEQDKLEQEQRRENEQDRVRQLGKNREEPESREGEKSSDSEKSKEGGAGGFMGGLLAGAAKGKFLKGKGRVMQFLIISGAVIGACFGVGLQPLFKCFKEEPFFSVIVILFWLGIIVALFMFILIAIGYAICSTPLVKASSWLLSLFNEKFKICQIFNDVMPDISQQPVTPLEMPLNPGMRR